MEFDDYTKVIWRWLWLIVLGVALASVSTYLAVREQPYIYETKATLVVGQTLQQEQPSQTDIWLAQSLADTYKEVAYRRIIRDATEEALGMEWLPEYTVYRTPNTQLLEINVTDDNPERAAAVANELANQLILYNPSNPQPDEEQRREFVSKQLDDLEVSIDATKAEITKLEEALSGMFSAREIASTQNQISALEGKLNSLQASYSRLLALMGEGAVNTLSVVERAAVPGSPIGPDKMRTILFAAAVGLVLAVATAFLLEYLDDTIKTPADVDKALHLIMLASVGRISGRKPRDKLITIKNPNSHNSEAYRVLRTNLQFSSVDEPLRTLVITSPNPVEGKSTTAANLGIVMAQAGKTVILVDSDLHQPALHRLFEMDSRYGLTDLLLSTEPLIDGYLQPTEVENLRLLSTGPLPPNSSELLASQRMATLIEQLKTKADLILFDSPPSLVLTDASVLATQVDGVLMVVDAGKTRRNRAKHAVERLRQVGISPLGVVLNRIRSGRGGSYYRYYRREKKDSR